MMRGLPLLVAAAAVASATAQVPDEPFDVVIRGGTVLDGTGSEPYRADIAVRGRAIVRVGNLERAEARTSVDARGLHVAPGFINIHSHAQADALPTAENVLTQGITTEILNPDGGGAVDLSTQMGTLERGGLAVNVGAYIGFNSIWTAVVGNADRRPGPDEIARMRELVVGGLEAGAWGVSAGLDYKPAYYASTEEVVSIVSAAAPWRTNFTNHDRLTPEAKFSSRAGVAETLLIGRRAGLLPVATHMKVQGHEQGNAGAVLEMFGAAGRADYAAADVYPYLAGQSGLGALIIPAWAQDGGRDAMLARFKDPTQRARIVDEAEEAMALRFGGASGVYLPASGRELTDVMREMGVRAGEAVVRLLEAENMGAILRFGAEGDLERILKHPAASVACDCGATTATRTHPRNYGTYPRVLGRYVRERGVLTLPEAIRKMTLLPAATIGMIDRGVIAPGAVADIVVFDAATVIDHATYEEPARLSEGIRHVFVNGQPALRDGRATGVRAGAALRRERHMPSRAVERGRRLKTSRVVFRPQDLTLDADLWQDNRDRVARGTVRVRGADGRVVLSSTALGWLHAAPRWTAVTGTGRVSLDTASVPAERAFRLVVERGPDGRDTTVLSIDGAATLTAIQQR